MRTRKFSFLLTVLVVPLFVLAQAAHTAVTIVVTDPSSTGVPHAQIRLVPSLDSAAAKLQTDAKGRLRIDLQPGGYALFITSPGFKRFSTHIEIQQSKSQTIPVVLQIAPSGSPTVYPSSDKDSLLLSAHPYHDDVILKLAELRAMPHVSVTVHDPHANADETYLGVRVADLLSKLDAPLGQELRGIALAGYLVATGSDGYQAVFSLAEVDPNFHPGDVLVADTMNGNPLDAKTGPLRLVVTEDKRPARSVRNLVSIELKSAD